MSNFSGNICQIEGQIHVLDIRIRMLDIPGYLGARPLHSLWVHSHRALWCTGRNYKNHWCYRFKLRQQRQVQRWQVLVWSPTKRKISESCQKRKAFFGSFWMVCNVFWWGGSSNEAGNLFYCHSSKYSNVYSQLTAGRENTFKQDKPGCSESHHLDIWHGRAPCPERCLCGSQAYSSCRRCLCSTLTIPGTESKPEKQENHQKMAIYVTRTAFTTNSVGSGLHT